MPALRSRSSATCGPVPSANPSPFAWCSPSSAPSRTTAPAATHTSYPHGKPDLSKLARSTEDALTDAGVWIDDSLVVAYGRLAKVYARDPSGFDAEALTVSGAVITVHPIAALPATHRAALGAVAWPDHTEET
jgi:hypothetical protein